MDAASGNPSTDFRNMPVQMLAAMQSAGDDMIAVLEEAADNGRHVLLDILKASEPDPFTQWEHYPPGDVHDRDNGAIWFYHAHAEDEAARPWTEHGHFHMFVYTEHLPDEAKPIALPENPDMEKGGLCHLVSISFDHSGTPTRIFTTNRWVTDEWMYPAEFVIPLIDKFEVNNESFSLTSRWLKAALGLFRPQIEWSLRERDRAIEKLRATNPGGFSEDRSVEVLSSFLFDFAGQIDEVESAMESLNGGVEVGQETTAQAR